MNDRYDPGHDFSSLEGLSPWAERMALNALWGSEPWPETAALAEGPPGLNCTVPHALFLPEGYVESYAYPVLVWLHGEGHDEYDVVRRLPEISDRNYIGLSLRGNRALPRGNGWSVNEQDHFAVLADLRFLLDGLAAEYPIHRQRIYLVGHGSGGDVALRLFLQKPEWFAGAASLGGCFPNMTHPLSGFRHLQGKRVLLSWEQGVHPKTQELVQKGRLLYQAGMQVATRVYHPNGLAPATKMLRDVDHWVMDSLQTAVRA